MTTALNLSRPKTRIQRHNFLHLYFDIAWFGVLSGSAMAFIAVYSVRIGASPLQVGLISAGPAFMTLLFALPAGWWLQRKPIDRPVFFSSIVFRFFYLFWIPLPILFGEPVQIWVIILTALLMSIPGTALAIGFNALFADVVAPEWRSQVVGVRNALLAISFMLTSLGCGWLLNHMTFPANYQVVFCIGFIGAAMSSFHLGKVDLNKVNPKRAALPLGDMAQPGYMQRFGEGFSRKVGLRFLTRGRLFQIPKFGILRGSFGPVLLALGIFHFVQQLPIPLYPIFLVEQLNLSDQTLSIGNALFYGFMFLGASQFGWITKRAGNFKSFIIGALLLSVYPGFLVISNGPEMYYWASVFGGVLSVLSVGALGNYLLERIPDEERPMHLAWYTVAANLAILFGSLAGPILASTLGITPALWISASMRLVSVLGIWYWGK